MKKFFAVLMAMMALLAITTAAQAQLVLQDTQSCVLSPEELKAVKKVAERVYPRGTQVNVKPTGPFLLGPYYLEFTTGDRSQRILMEVKPVQAKAWVREIEADEGMTAVGEKIRLGIEEILNKPGRQALK